MAKSKNIPQYILHAVAEALDPGIFKPSHPRVKQTASHLARRRRLKREAMAQARKAIWAYEKVVYELLNEKR